MIEPAFPKDRMAYVRLKLVQILMGHGEADAIFAKFRKHVRQGQGGEALEFVDVDEEVAALGRAACRPG